MPIKSNYVEKIKRMMDQKPRYGFRKLSVGITSVMLGVTFFLAGGKTTLADTSSSQSQAGNTVESHQIEDSELSGADSQDLNSKQVEKPDQAKAEDTDKNTIDSKNSQSSDQTNNQGLTDKIDQKTNLKSEAVQAAANAQAKLAAKINAADTNLSTTDENGITLSISRDTVGADGTPNADINIALSGSFQKGQVYNIDVPVTTFGIDNSNFQNISVANRGLITKNDRVENGQKYRNYTLTVVDNFTTTSGFKLVIKDGNNYGGKAIATSPNAIDPAGEVKREIKWSYYDADKATTVNNKSLYFTTIIKNAMNPTIRQVKPDPQVTQLQTNTTYDFEVDLNQGMGLQDINAYGAKMANESVNMGTTITIPVPAGFVIDPAASLKATGRTDGSVTITQAKAGADIIITVAAGTGSQYYKYETGYHLVGKFTQLVGPSENKVFTADGKITVDQKVRTVNGLSTISVTIDKPWSVNLVGPNVTPKQGQINAGIVGNNSSSTFIQGQKAKIVNYFGFTNNTSISFTGNFNIQIGFDPNLIVTGIKTPDFNDVMRPGLTTYRYIIEVLDQKTQKHSFINASVEAGQVIEAPTGSIIYKASIIPNYVEVGASTRKDLDNIIKKNAAGQTQQEDGNVFEAYGTISDELNEMSPIAPDTKVVTKLAISSPAFNNNETTTESIDQKVLGLDSLKASMQSYAFQQNITFNPANRDPNYYGYIDIHTDSDPNATTSKIFEPIFYYVLPKYFTYTGSWDNVDLKAVDADTGKVVEPKFSTYVVDGRQVVKLDYTGTGFNFNTGVQGQDRLHISIDPDALAGTYRYDTYIYTKTGITSYDKKYDQDIDDQTKAFTQDITNSGIAGTLYHPKYLYGNSFRIQAPVIAYVPNTAQGNKDAKASVHGTSDSKGDSAMYYYVNVANYDISTIKDGMLLINVPLASDGDNSFDFTVDGPVTYDSLYDASFDNSFTFYYANDVQRLPNVTEKGTQPSLDNYVTADQVSDWSKVKSVIVKFSKDIPAADQIGRFVIKGHDANMKNDAGKTGYIRVALTGSNFTPFVTTNTGITIEGQATINTRLHYVDANGADQYIDVPSMSKSYNENKDYVRVYDFKGSNIPISLIPENYELASYSPKWIVTNSEDQGAGFNKQAKYYFDGDIVQFELKHKQTVDVKTIDATTYYEYDESSSKYQKDGTDEQNSIIVNGQKVAPTTVSYRIIRTTDLVTGKSTYLVVDTNLDQIVSVDDLGNFTIPGIKTLPALQGYTPNTSESTLAKADNTCNINTLFAANPDKSQLTVTKVVHYIPDKQAMTYTMYNETQQKWITTSPIAFAEGRTDDDASGIEDVLAKKVHDFLTPNAYDLDEIQYYNRETGKLETVKYDDSFDIDKDKLVVPGKFNGSVETNNVVIYVKDPVTFTQQSKIITRTINYHDADQNGEYLNSLPINPLPSDEYPDWVQQGVKFTRFEVVDAVTSAVLGYYKPSQMELNGVWKPKAGETYIPYDANDKYQAYEISISDEYSDKFDAVTNYDLIKYGYEGPVDVNGNSFTKIEASTPSVDSASTVVDVYYHHKLAIIAPDKLPAAGQKVNPADPNSPVYPSNNYDPTDPASQAISTVQRIIHHVYANGTEINGVDVSGQAVKGLNDVTQTVTFYQDALIDLVTGKITQTGKYRAVKSTTEQNGQTTSVDNTDQFVEVTSASIDNYLPVESSVQAETAALGDKVKEFNIAYVADQTDAVITYVDADNAGSTIAADTLHGAHGSAIVYNTADQIKELESRGYELVTDGYSEDSSGDKYFDNSKAQKWVVTMRHKKITINPDNHHQAGDKIDWPGYTATYPQGVDQDDLNRTISRTIKFQYAQGTKYDGQDLSGQTVTDNDGKPLEDIVQKISYERSATIDLVKLADAAQAANAVTYSYWKIKDGSATDFASVDVLPVEGYETNTASVKEQAPIIDLVNGPENAKDSIVTYSAKNQSINVLFVDRDGNVIEPQYTLEGVTGQKVKVADPFGDPFTPPEGWKLVDPNTKIPSEVIFGRKPLSDIKIEIEHATIHLNHDEYHKANTDTLPDNHIRPYPAGVGKNDLNQTVTRTIRVHLPDGSIKSLDQVLRFTRGATIDEINGNVTYDPWVAVDGTTMKAVSATDITQTPEGYSPLIGAVELTGITPDAADSIVDISYEPNTQTAKLRIVDDDTLVDGQPKELFRADSSGKFGSKVVFADLNYELAKLKKANYQVDIAMPADSKYQADDSKNNFVVHVSHMKVLATSSRDIREQVSYVFVDKNGVEHTIAPEYYTNSNDRIVFVQHGIFDLVTDTYTWNHEWNLTSTTNKFKEIASPEVQGYVIKPGMETIPVQEVKIDEENGNKIIVVNDQLNGQIAQANTDKQVQTWVISYKIYYQAAPQKTTVTYVDDDEQEKQVGEVQELTGHSFDSVETNITNPDLDKYEIVNGDDLPDEIVFTTSGYPVITVHLKHKFASTTRTLKTTRTIVYVNEQGQQLADPVVQTLTFTQTGKQDLVTGEITWDPQYEQSLSWKEVVSPEVPGYTPDQTKANEQKLTVTNADFTKGHDQMVVVTYVANDQSAGVIYVDDDNNGQEIATGEINGKTDQTVPTNITNPDETKYELVPGYATEITFGPDKHSAITVHVRHKKENVTRTKDVTLTVTFELPDGTSVEKTAKLTFVQAGVHDLATDETVWEGDYQASSQFAIIDVPYVNGYHPSDVAGGQEILVNAQNWNQNLNISQLITYEADPAIPDQPENPTKPVKPVEKPHTPKAEADAHEEHHGMGYVENRGNHNNHNEQPIEEHQSMASLPKIDGQASAQLPQTGEKKQTSSLGWILLALSGLLVLVFKKKDRE